MSEKKKETFGLVPISYLKKMQERWQFLQQPELQAAKPTFDSMLRSMKVLSNEEFAMNKLKKKAIDVEEMTEEVARKVGESWIELCSFIKCDSKVQVGQLASIRLYCHYILGHLKGNYGNEQASIVNRSKGMYKLQSKYLKYPDAHLAFCFVMQVADLLSEGPAISPAEKSDLACRSYEEFCNFGAASPELSSSSLDVPVTCPHAESALRSWTYSVRCALEFWDNFTRNTMPSSRSADNAAEEHMQTMLRHITEDFESKHWLESCLTLFILMAAARCDVALLKKIQAAACVSDLSINTMVHMGKSSEGLELETENGSSARNTPQVASDTTLTLINAEMDKAKTSSSVTRKQGVHGWPCQLVLIYVQSMADICMNGLKAEIRKVALLGRNYNTDDIKHRLLHSACDGDGLFDLLCFRGKREFSSKWAWKVRYVAAQALMNIYSICKSNNDASLTYLIWKRLHHWKNMEKDEKALQAIKNEHNTGLDCKTELLSEITINTRIAEYMHAVQMSLDGISATSSEQKLETVPIVSLPARKEAFLEGYENTTRIAKMRNTITVDPQSRTKGDKFHITATQKLRDVLHSQWSKIQQAMEESLERTEALLQQAISDEKVDMYK